jgi:carboxylesterase type B
MFHRAIIQSGTSKCPWSLQTPVGEYTKILAEHLDCPTTNSREILDCLRTRKAEDIVGIRRHITIPELVGCCLLNNKN